MIQWFNLSGNLEDIQCHDNWGTWPEMAVLVEQRTTFIWEISLKHAWL
jgi:hypothetical protein